jgi:integrase
VTVHDLLTAFEELHVSQLKQPASVRCKIRKYFPSLHAIPLEALSVSIVTGWVNDIRRHSSCQADGCLTILRTMLKKAVEWEMFKGANVAQVIKRKRAPRRKRYVLKEEMPALVHEIEREPLMHQVYFYLLLFVGPRPGEAEVMQRTHLKLFQTPSGMVGSWTKPTTKNGDTHEVPLPAFVCELLRWYLTTLPAHQEYLFSLRPGQSASHEAWHLRWKEVRRRAGLLDVQMRDIRRTCATYLLNLQQSKMDLLTLSKGVMNHRDLNTTQIYAQPMIETIQRSMDQNVSNIRQHVTPPQGSAVWTPEQDSGPSGQSREGEERLSIRPQVPSRCLQGQEMEWPG